MKTVLVTGIARGGTSMTTGLLHCLGIYVPEGDNIPQDRLKWNPKGAFETPLLRTLNNELISEFDFFNSEISDEFEWQVIKRMNGRIEEILEEMRQEHSFWGFKVLNNGAFPLLVKVVQRPLVIVVGRNWIRNVQSWVVITRERKGRHVESFEWATKKIIEEIEVLVSGLERVQIPKLFLSFEEIRSDGLGQAKKMAEFVGVKWVQKIEEKVKAFVDASISTWSEKDVVFDGPRKVLA